VELTRAPVARILVQAEVLVETAEIAAPDSYTLAPVQVPDALADIDADPVWVTPSTPKSASL